MFKFQKLEIYNRSKSFHKKCVKITELKGVNTSVKNQLYRASHSIILNIAEGSGRFTNADRRNFFIISRSSIFECAAILDLLKDEKFIAQNNFEKLLLEADELSRMLYKMIKNLS